MNQKKTEVGLVKRLVCGLLCAMVCATATACTTQQARPDLGQGTESEQIRDTEAPTVPPAADQGPDVGGNENTPSGGEQTPEGGNQTPSGGGQTPTTPETPSQPQTPPTLSALLELCNSKMATVATFGVQSKMKYELEGLGSAIDAGYVYEDQMSTRAEGLGTAEQAIQCIDEGVSITMVDGAYYMDLQDLKIKVTMTAEQYDAQFANVSTNAFLSYGAEDFGGSEIIPIEGGYRIKFKDPTNDTLREMLALFDTNYATSYANKTWEDITEFAYTVEIAADGTLMREYLFIKFDELLDPDTYGAGAIGIVRLTYEDLYSGYGSEKMITKPADEENYMEIPYEDIFGEAE